MVTPPTVTGDAVARPLWHALRAALEREGDAPAVHGDESVLTRADLLQGALRRADELAAAGAGPGRAVLVRSGRGAAFLEDLLAAWCLGAPPAPLDAGASRGAVLQLSALAGAVAEATGAGIRRLAEAADAEPIAAEVGAVLFTSGTLGRPKAVALTQAALLANVGATLARLPLSPGDRLAVAIPLHFTSAICHFLATVLGGATLVATECAALPSDLAALLRRRRATAFGGAPLQLRWIAESADVAGGLRWVMASGDRLPAATVHLLQRAAPDTRIVPVYGLTEVAGRFCVLDPEEVSSAPESVGVPIPGMRVTVRDEAGHLCPPGVVGEVYAAGPCVALSYLRNHDATAAAFRDGAFRTGDLGHMDASGRLWLEGRTDDVFKVSGQKVSAYAIVDALLATGWFADAAVLPVTAGDGVVVPEAWVVPQAGTNAPTRGAVLRMLRGRLAPFQLPAEIHAVASIPRTGSGKVLRRALLDG